MKTRLRWIIGLLALAVIVLPGLSMAQDKQPVVIGAVIAETGPASSLGTGEVKAINMLVKQINANGGVAGHALKVPILNSESNPQNAVLAVRKLITRENAVGVVCCTTSPESMAILDTIKRFQVPNISIAASATIVEPASERHWIFKTPPLDSTMVAAEVQHMKEHGITEVGFIGFSDAYGQSGLEEFKEAAKAAGIEIVEVEQYARTDTNLSAQASRLVAANPQAILIWAIPPGANRAQKALLDAGYDGIIYQSYGVTNDTFMRLGGESLNGTFVSVLPVIVHNQLPDSLPFKPVVQKFVADYKAAYGETPSSFAGHAYDAVLIFATVAENILESGKVELSDTAAFREALRDGIESLGEFQAVDGTFNFSPTDHVGLGPSSAVMVEIQDGGYKVVE